MYFTTWVVALAALLNSNVYAQSSFSPARPPSIPLAVRNPYLSTWLMAGSDGGNGGYLAGEWPTFWTGQVTGWTGLIKVDGLNYIWMGAPVVTAALVEQVAFSYTATRSTFTMNVDDVVGMVIEFLSPVVPDDTVRSSLSAAYMNVEVYSLDGKAHDVHLYSDISAEWCSGDRNDLVQWSYGIAPAAVPHKRSVEDAAKVVSMTTKSHKTYGTKTTFDPTKPAVTSTSTYSPYSWTSQSYTSYPPDAKIAKTTTTKTKSVQPTVTPGTAYHQVFRQSQSVFDEASDQADWGYWYYATSNVANLTYQSGSCEQARSNFVNFTYLPNSQDPYYRAINVDYPGFAFAVDLGSVGTAPVSTLFTINLMQQPVIAYENGITNTNETLYGLWTRYFNDDLDAVTYFYDDYAAVSKLCTAIDKKIMKDSIKAGGENYYIMTALATRQALGALQLAANGTADDYYAHVLSSGTPINDHMSCYIVFMKEISSDGNIQTVDVIFPLHPILLYLNPTWLKLLLEPLFVNQEAGYWPYQFSIHDLGQHYPVAEGNNNGIDEMQPLEECGNMIIMALAYAQRANDNAWLASHYDILRQWNQYLIEEALIPQYQISTDDFAGALANQTNLALKGIVGIAAMAEIANRTGNVQDGINFTQIALSYIAEWQILGIAHDALPPHTTLNYGANNTYSLLYNLYYDSLLNLGLVPQSVYNMQSKYYPQVQLPYGIPLDTRHTYTKLDWEILCASIAKKATREDFINKIANWINTTPTNYPLTDLYDAVSGNYPGFDFIARPVVGSLFGLLALESAPSVAALGG